MKIIQLPPEDNTVINNVIEIEALAFSNITFGEEFMFINFECIESEFHMLLCLSIPILLENEYEEAMAKDMYEDIVAPSGLLLSKEKLSTLMITDTFRKLGSDIFTVNTIESLDYDKNIEKSYYNIELTTKQFILVMSILHDVMELFPVYYQSHIGICYIPEDCTLVNVDSSVEVEVLAANPSTKSISAFGDPNKEFAAQVLCNFKFSEDKSEKIIMNLSYKRADMKAIQKANKLPTIDLNNIDDKSDIFIISDHTVVDYSIKSTTPIGKIVWVAEGANGEYRLYSMLNNDYISIVEKINSSIK